MIKKLFQARIWRRIYIERAGEPMLYNLISIFVLFFGKFEQKIAYDLIPRQPYAFGLQAAFNDAKKSQIKKIILIEFGVAAGAGLFNIAKIAKILSKAYEIDYEVIGFDSGEGMPKPVDYRDHPEKYGFGDFPPMGLDPKKLPEKTTLILGPISETIDNYKRLIPEDARIGFVSVDVDYYSSTVECLKIFEGSQSIYLPKVVVYLDDVNNVDHNKYCGELLAVEEFNCRNVYRKICQMTQLRNWRIFKDALWLDQMYFAHILDSDFRSPKFNENRNVVKLYNPYIHGLREMTEDAKHVIQ